MTGFVVATSGHVDHGKSALVRALTGIEPDRWAEEQRRGLTIDLGFAWFGLPSGRGVAFVDVPGHERFLGNMLAGLGPAPVVLFVVAADRGWQQQSDDHLAAAVALGIRHGVVAITRRDLADDATLDGVRADVRRRLEGSGLAAAPIVPVSARTRAGLPDLRRALDAVLATVPPADDDAPVRLWVDRSFSIRGAGTVVTGTLAGGRIATGDALALVGERGERAVIVRGLEVQGEPVDAVTGVHRVAVNLRGAAADAVRRGDALVQADAWWNADTVDARRVSGSPLDDLPRELVAHVGSAAVPITLRPLGAEHARVRFAHALPLHVGDRVVLRDPGGHTVVGGLRMLDVDPPPLRRRGAARRRADELASMPATGSLGVEVARRGAMRDPHARRLGIPLPSELPAEVLRHGEWLVDRATLGRWALELRAAVERDAAADPLTPGLSRGAAAGALALPDPSLLAPLVRAARLDAGGGRIRSVQRADLGAAERGVAAIERRLAAAPFAAPEADDLASLGLGPRELATAERVGRLLRLEPGIVLLPSAPAAAAARLAALPQPFTLSEARQALGTTRRVAVPLLELLDRRGATRRIDATRRAMTSP